MLAKGALVAWCAVFALAAQESKTESRAASRPAVEIRLEHGTLVRIVPVDIPGEIVVLVAMKGAGILAEPAGAPHLAHVSEHAVFHAAEDAEIVDRWFAQGRANAETLPELMYFDFYPEKTGLRDALRIAVRRAHGAFTIEEAVVAREKPVALSEVRHLEANRTPSADMLGKFAWSPFVQIGAFGAKHVPFAAFTESIEAAAVRGFCGSGRFRPDHAMIVVVGDIDPGTVRDALVGFAKEMAPPPVEAPASRPRFTSGTHEGSWDVDSRQFFMTWPAPPSTDPAHPALTLLGAALPHKLLALPALRPLAMAQLGVHADAGGLFVIQMPLKARANGEAVAAEIERILAAHRDHDDTLRTLLSFRSSVRQNAGLGRVFHPRHPARKIMGHANQELVRMRATLAWGQAAEDYVERVNQVTPAELRAAIRTWLAPEKAATVTIAGKD